MRSRWILGELMSVIATSAAMSLAPAVAHSLSGTPSGLSVSGFLGDVVTYSWVVAVAHALSLLLYSVLYLAPPTPIRRALAGVIASLALVAMIWILGGPSLLTDTGPQAAVILGATVMGAYAAVWRVRYAGRSRGVTLSGIAGGAIS